MVVSFNSTWYAVAIICPMASTSPGSRFVPFTGSTITDANAGTARVRKSGTVNKALSRMGLLDASYGPIPRDQRPNPEVSVFLSILRIRR